MDASNPDRRDALYKLVVDIPGKLFPDTNMTPQEKQEYQTYRGEQLVAFWRLAPDMEKEIVFNYGNHDPRLLNRACELFAISGTEDALDLSDKIGWGSADLFNSKCLQRLTDLCWTPELSTATTALTRILEHSPQSVPPLYPRITQLLSQDADPNDRRRIVTGLPLQDEGVVPILKSVLATDSSDDVRAEAMDQLDSISRDDQKRPWLVRHDVLALIQNIHATTNHEQLRHWAGEILARY